ncbi:YegP family protein [Curtobacterium flaccumfaciens]|uniref:YegP family protein n=1 Tax=Curtobacterium flaccumfaciens TaxID=2035 RepID=UPI001BDE8787|nr:DUF1508 domain-containing protein [Curtobacterium flaccumfaciens]MBT1631304.1 DUF1508 domain-containing protein [Curtobacterium flaccumfaciens pv. oortii]MCS5521485.1 DUF1508 domain-containing protein [Curtobacterium flaccumfaciens pv. oortii]MCX2844575.1 DUF1508 domain-containing protein [Curtobacterium flaccumfaciens pv. oortii]
MSLRFSIQPTQNAQWSWWLYAGNGEMVAWAGETFVSSTNAQRAASSFKAGALTARYDVYLDTAGKWRWRASRSSDKVAASGESFASHANAERAATSVRMNGGTATGA